MTVTLREGVVVLSGDCGSSDVEELLTHCQTMPELKVDLRHASHLHGAVLQMLLVFRPCISAPAEDPFVRQLTAELVKAGT